MAKDRSLAVKGASSALGLGYLPVAPGTWASAAAAGVYWLLRRLPSPGWQAALGALLVLVTLLGFLVSPRAQAIYKHEDPRHFVLDEIAGQWLVYLGFWWRFPLATAIVGFLVFRAFDIVKPFPIRRLEKLPRGWGIMGDDLAAAVYSILALWAVCYGVLDQLIA